MDTQKLRQLIADYKFAAAPERKTLPSTSDPATIGDINRAISATANLFIAFLNELEKS